MSGQSSLPRSGAIYVATVVAVGSDGRPLLNLRTRDSRRLPQRQLQPVVSARRTHPSECVRYHQTTVSSRDNFDLRNIRLHRGHHLGPAAGAVIVALDGFLISMWPNRRKELHRVAFNVAAPALSIWLSAQVYYLFPGVHRAHTRHSRPIQTDSSSNRPAGIFTLTHFLMNSWLITFAVAFETRRPAFALWRSDFLWLSLNYFGGASVSALLAVQVGTVQIPHI